ncbi:MAG: peptidylprolyl isomerase [Chloroflexi bacterium]|nr:peptidylprolyl isomerase [Chloroflexota bacterium]
MTLRAKPVVKGPGRSGWHSDDRRAFLTNVGFAAVIVISILLLIGYAGYSWYSDHFGAAATVDETTINRDQLRARVAVETFRIDYTEGRIRTLNAAGRLTDSSMTSQLQFLEQRRQSIPSIALERLIDIVIQSKLATSEGVSVSDADVDAQLTAEKTLVEQRHAWVIEVAPDVNKVTAKPGDAEKAAARDKAAAALKDLQSGKAWEDVAKAVSTAASAAQGGDLGWVPKDSGYDEPFMTAVFAGTQNTPTAVIEGDDGTFRIGRYTEVAPAAPDDTFQTQLDDAKISLADYRQVIRADLVRKALDAKVVANLSAPSKQRNVLQIFMSSGLSATTGVKVRHILSSPKHDPNAAQTLPLTDPAWQTAKDEATAIYNQVVADPSKFDELARTKSDESSAAETGGKLPFFDATSGIDPAFAKAIFAPDLKPGQILPPVQSAFGWHVIQFMRPLGDGDEAWMKQLRTQLIGGADFAALARDQGEGPEAAQGGDIGWVATGQFDAAKEKPIFAAAVDGVTDVTTIASDGVYLWKVIGEEVRTPTKDQIATFKKSGFTNWYAAKKALAKITRSVSTTSATP